MKTKIIGLLVSLAGLSLTAAEPQYVIPEGGTHFVGKTGSGFQNAAPRTSSGSRRMRMVQAWCSRSVPSVPAFSSDKRTVLD